MTVVAEYSGLAEAAAACTRTRRQARRERAAGRMSRLRGVVLEAEVSEVPRVPGVPRVLTPEPSEPLEPPEPLEPLLRFPVAIGAGSHPFPFRTRKLSLLPPMVLRARVRGRVGRCREYFHQPAQELWAGFFVYSRQRPSEAPRSPRARARATRFLAPRGRSALGPRFARAWRLVSSRLSTVTRPVDVPSCGVGPRAGERLAHPAC
jgi:hypothetical protein